jgi:hypothetical protein
MHPGCTETAEHRLDAHHKKPISDGERFTPAFADAVGVPREEGAAYSLADAVGAARARAFVRGA